MTARGSAWSTGAGALTLLAAIHLATLLISPVPWQDEVQIVDLGRAALSPDPQWAINWTAHQRPVVFFNYLGPAIQEAAYRLLAPSPAGPRLSALAGAWLASLLMLAWLRQRAVHPLTALACAAMFFLDPLFAQSYRGARVDAWVFALAIGACALVRSSAVPEMGVAPRLLRIGSASMLMVAGVFVWPSAIYLGPLFAGELVETWISLRPPPRQLIGWTGALSLGIVAGVALCLLPVAARVPYALDDLFYASSQYYQRGPVSARVLRSIGDLPHAFLLSPLLPIVAAAAASRTWLMAAAGLLALAGMLPTWIYTHRVVYLVPYFTVVIAGMWSGRVQPHVAWRGALALIVAWAAAVSLLVRPVQALIYRHGRSPERHREVAARLGELRDARVYLGAWDFYYAGREHHWKMVRGYGDVGPQALGEMLSRMDYALLADSDPLKASPVFIATGWRVIERFELPPVQGLLVPGPPRRYELYARDRR